MVADTSPPSVTRPPATEIGSDGSVCAPDLPAKQTSSFPPYQQKQVRIQLGSVLQAVISMARIIVRGVEADGTALRSRIRFSAES